MAEHFSFEEIHSVLRLEEGRLFWRVSRGPVSSGRPAGKTDRHGYAVVRYKDRDLLAHRIIWLLIHGRWPTDQIDHINGNRSDNRPENLRQATNTQNQYNRLPTREFKGVTRHKTGKFQASCSQTYLGLFDSAEQAARAYDDAAIKKHGDFARLNFGRAEP